MTKSSEIIGGFPGTSPLSERKIKPKLEVIKGRKSREEIVEEIKRGKIGKVSPKVEKKVVKKVVAILSTITVGGTGGFIALGETGNLPEQAQEWYDSTSEDVRAFFGIEVVDETNSQPEAPFSGLEIEGLNATFQNDKWEYVDPNDGSVVGFWNENEGKYEHTASILKGEWKGLFVSQSLEEVKEKFEDEGEWTVNNWNNGKIKIPLPFDVTKGGLIEEIKAWGNFIRGSKTGTVIGISNLPSESIVFSPVPFREWNLLTRIMNDSASFGIVEDSVVLNFDFKNTSQCLIPDNGYPDNPYNGPEYTNEYRLLFLGSPILQIKNDEVLPKTSTLIVNPFVSNNFQVLITATEEDGGPINFSFNNLLRDNEGRFIFINPGSSEIELMKNTIEEERSIFFSEEKKEALEEKIENLSLVENSEVAPLIDGLSFDKEVGSYFADEGNPYGLNEDEKAGVFVDGFIGLNSKVIDYLQSEKIGLQIPLPFISEDGNNIEIVEEVDSGINYLLIRPSKKIVIYSPIDGLCHDSHGNRSWGPDKGAYQGLNFDLNGKTLFSINSKKIDYYSHKEEVTIGDKLGEIDSDILIELKSDNLLKINNNLVFILPNE